MAENYGKRGFFKLWRSEMDNPLYTEEPFDKWHAWMDLCLLADSNGAVKTSIKALKNRWSWGSENKVRNLLGAVERAGLGAVTSVPNKGTLIRLNIGVSGTSKKAKKKQNGAVNGAVQGFEELTSVKEVGDRTSLISPAPDNHNKNNMQYLEDELGDEYES